MHRRSAALLEIHLAVFLFGTAAVLAKLTDLNAAEIVLGRTCFATLTLIWIVRPRAVAVRRWGRSAAVYLLLGLLLAFHWVSFFHAVITAGVAVGLITFSSFPLFTTILEPYAFPVRHRARDILYACGVVAGVALVLPEYDFRNATTVGALWGLASGFSFAVLQILNRRYVQETPAGELALGQNAVACVGLLVVCGIPDVTRVPLNDWLLLIVLGTLCTAFAHTLFIRGLDSLSTQTASIITCLEPVYGIGLAMLWLGELPSPRVLLGGSVILATVLSATRDSPSPNPDAEDTELPIKREDEAEGRWPRT